MFIKNVRIVRSSQRFSCCLISFSNNFEIVFRMLTGLWFFLDMQSIDLKIEVISANFNLSWNICNTKVEYVCEYGGASINITSKQLDYLFPMKLHLLWIKKNQIFHQIYGVQLQLNLSDIESMWLYYQEDLLCYLFRGSERCSHLFQPGTAQNL